MRTPANIAKHPIHPMLIPIPIGLWIFSFVCDLVYMFGGGPNWQTVALYNMVGGIVGALAAAVPGIIDMLSLTGEHKKIALIHMSLNLTIVVLYIINSVMRISNPDKLGLPVLLSLVAVLMLVVSGWLGGKMVYEHGVAVDIDAGHAGHEGHER